MRLQVTRAQENHALPAVGEARRLNAHLLLLVKGLEHGAAEAELLARLEELLQQHLHGSSPITMAKAQGIPRAQVSLITGEQKIANAHREEKPLHFNTSLKLQIR